MIYTASNGAKTNIDIPYIERLCDRLRGKTVLHANRGDMVIAAAIIEEYVLKNEKEVES